MSHELRTPLNSLLILSKLLADNPAENLTDQQVEFARTIHQAGTDLLTLISDILDLSKVEAGKMEINPAPLDTAEVLEGLERSFRPVAEEKGLELVARGRRRARREVVSDEQRVAQILRNLLSNAVKFTDSGSVKLALATRRPSSTTAGAPYALAFTVTDTGIGIPQDKLRLIFEAFQQADGTTSRRYGGTGLGLSISREIARLLGGEIRVAVDGGRGLDVHAAAAGGPAAAARARSSLEPRAGVRGRRSRRRAEPDAATRSATTASRSPRATASC